MHEELTDHIKSWHLHLRTMSQNFRKIGSGLFKLLPFLSLNDPTDKNAFGQFGYFSRVGSHLIIYWSGSIKNIHLCFHLIETILNCEARLFRRKFQPNFLHSLTKIKVVLLLNLQHGTVNHIYQWYVVTEWFTQVAR